jgi:hypothetical protein
MANISDIIEDSENRGSSAVVGALAELDVMRWDPARMAYVFSEGTCTEEDLYDRIDEQQH